MDSKSFNINYLGYNHLSSHVCVNFVRYVGTNLAYAFNPLAY
jgi:hypothetical protein